MNKVSIIIPLYNAQDYIEECINSALNQTYPNIEIIVVNDGSTDNSLSIANKFSNKKCIKIISQPNKGAAAARNVGLLHSTGEYIQFLDSDDILDSHKIEEQINIFRNNNWNKNIIVFGKWTKLGMDISKMSHNQTSIWHTYQVATDILIDFSLNCCCLPPNVYLTPKTLINKVGYWNESLTKNDDGEFFARILNAASSLIFCNTSLALYRPTPNSLSKRISHQAAFSQIQSQILMSEIIIKSENVKAKEAIYQMLNASLRSLYPYYKKQRKIGEKYLFETLKMKASYSSLNWKEWLNYLLHPTNH